MSETRKIDVIIPTYLSDEKLEKCLRMLKRQTVQPQRILLINTEEEFFHSKVFSTLKQGRLSISPSRNLITVVPETRQQQCVMVRL